MVTVIASYIVGLSAYVFLTVTVMCKGDPLLGGPPCGGFFAHLVLWLLATILVPFGAGLVASFGGLSPRRRKVFAISANAMTIGTIALLMSVSAGAYFNLFYIIAPAAVYGSYLMARRSPLSR